MLNISRELRFVKKFYEKYQDRLLYGTDMGFEDSMYEATFRILESADEHFYMTEQFNYHWACNGLDLDDRILKKYTAGMLPRSCEKQEK
jgi:hypothetical protein